MAEILDNGDFWLSHQFLSDDSDNTKAVKESAMGSLPYGFRSLGGFSYHTSPVESVLSSTETESDDDDYLARAAHFRLEDDLKKALNKGWFLSGSPQSTLCPLGNGCRCKQCSSNGSSNCPSRVPTPPATWNLLFAAQEELARMRLKEDVNRLNHMNELPGRSVKPSPISVPVKHSRPDATFYHPQSLTHQQLLAIQLEQLKRQMVMKQMNSKFWDGQTKASAKYPRVVQQRSGYLNGSKNVRPLGLSPSAWPPLQRQHQLKYVSDMRGVCLAPSGVKKECAGTGVFLPRQIGSTPSAPPRKKPGCSPVLPTRVVQALNLNLDEMGVQQAKMHPRFIGEVSLRQQDGNTVAQQRRFLGHQQPAVMDNEIRLPQEWTY